MLSSVRGTRERDRRMSSVLSSVAAANLFCLRYVAAALEGASLSDELQTSPASFGGSPHTP